MRAYDMAMRTIYPIILEVKLQTDAVLNPRTGEQRFRKSSVLTNTSN